MTSTPPLILHQSDIKEYLKCRRSWRFSSTHDRNLGLEPNDRIGYFWVGTAIHAALAEYYNPVRGQDFDIVEFAMRWVDRWKAENDEITAKWGPEKWDYLSRDTDLVLGMLANYPSFAQEADDFDVIAPEQPFSVQLMDEDGRPFRVHTANHDRQTVDERDVWIQGTRDAVVRDRRMGKLHTLEHKAYKSFDERKLLRDLQVLIYTWAGVKQYREEFGDSYYNVLFKRTPIVPPVAYRGKSNERISKAKDVMTNTTYDLFMQVIEREGYNPRDYQDELDVLKRLGWGNFYQRVTVQRNAHEIVEVERHLRVIAQEMSAAMSYPVNHPSSYPTPDDLRCPTCFFLEPCLAMSQGGDWKGLLLDPDLYRQRESMDTEIA